MLPIRNHAMNLTRRELLSVMLAASVAPTSRAAATQTTPPDTLRIGLTPVILADQAAFLSRWAAYLAERVDTEIRFLARNDYQVILDMLLEDRIDAAWLCGYPYVLHRPALSLAAVPLYRSEPSYQSYLIRPVGSSLSGWQDMSDKVLAYSDRLSNSGWLVAQTQLMQAGIAPDALKRTFYAHGHRNVAESVAARLADAGTIDGYVWDTMRLQNMEAAQATEVIWRSQPFGFPPILQRVAATHPALPRLQEALLSMHQDDRGQALLGALNLDGFIKGDPELYSTIRHSAERVAEARRH